MSIEQQFRQIAPQYRIRNIFQHINLFVLLYNYTVMARREAKKLRAGN